MMLTDSDILKHRKDGYIEISSWNEERLGSNSYDLTLSKHLKVYTDDVLDCKRDNPTLSIIIPDHGFTLKPRELYLGSTVEYTKTHESIVPQLEGKSSIARLGICIHLTAGFGDCGFAGHWTLDITCVKPVIIYAGMPIAQIYYFMTLGKCIKPYYTKRNAKYNEQGAMPVASAMHKNFK
jgi:dCTP deaminase